MLTQAQLDHYYEYGYLVLRSFIEADEVALLHDEVQRLLAEAPTKRGETTNAAGQTVSYPHDFAFANLDEAGDQQILNRISNQLARSEVMLQAYGNPKLLSAVESLYGEDWVPFAESIVIKLPDQGTPFWWHQDGSFKTGPVPERGVNFGIYLYPSTEENGCLRVIPKSHTWGQVDLQAMISEHGEQLPDSIPVPADPGDILVHSRNLIHGSFANTSPDMRVTVYFGFHARKTVEGVYDAAHILQRMQVVPYAIRLRSQSERFASETPYVYQPLVDSPVLGLAEQQAVLRAAGLSV